ncbi:hypothetical protein SDC9_160481 [bioreactor metagenome]|uniref:Uncharacterized protein n=1 Tax=bioreactor metagenome TaxID=1076179 RepID=A0A645FFL6_9ZZZZ
MSVAAAFAVLAGLIAVSLALAAVLLEGSPVPGLRCESVHHRADRLRGVLRSRTARGGGNAHRRAERS